MYGNYDFVKELLLQQQVMSKYTHRNLRDSRDIDIEK